mgnify:FL=1
MNEYLENQLNKSVVYQQLKDNCERNNQHEVLALVAKVGTFAVERLKTVIKNMPEFTLHDDTHIFNMLTIIGKLIPQENMRKLSTPDLFMLIVSVFLHDIGMAPDEKHILAWKNQLPETEYDEELKEEREKFARFRLTYTHQLADIERLEAEQEFSKAQLLEDYIVTEYIRTTHSIRAREIIAKYWAGEIVYQDTDLTENLATICFSHNESYTYLLQMETFRVCGQDEYLCIPFVATVLRLADIIDFDPKRTPSVLFSHLAVKNPVSLSEWKKHQSINAWTISPRKLLFSAQCEHPAIEATILAFCDQIDEELRNGTVILSNLSDEGMDIDVEVYKIPLPPQVDRRKIQAKKDIISGKSIYRYHDTKFSLSKKQIIDLLMGTKLYGKPEVALRELLQNSIDACLLRQKLSELWGIEYTPKVNVSLYTKNNVDYLRVSDNGVGMNQHIIDNYYTNVGCSYYSSREFSELMVSFKSSFTPISRFGIGILSCFMVCDSMEVTTRRIRERFECDEALHISIEGYESLFVISDSDKKEPGTDTILTLRPVHPWDRMNEEEFMQCIKAIVPNPAVQIEIETNKGSELYSSDYFDDLDLEFITPYKTYTKQSKEEFFEKMERMPHPDGDDVEVAKFFMENVSKRLVFDQSKEEILSKDVCKINSHLQPGKSYNRLYKFLEKYSSSIVNAPCDKNLIEITKQGVNKGNAVHWLGQYLHIGDDEIAVYGDGGNDLQMLSMFEHSYAPCTALEEAKYAANNQLGPYYEYSVARNMLETLAKQK